MCGLPETEDVPERLPSGASAVEAGAVLHEAFLGATRHLPTLSMLSLWERTSSFDTMAVAPSTVFFSHCWNSS